MELLRTGRNENDPIQPITVFSRDRPIRQRNGLSTRRDSTREQATGEKRKQGR
jgi:hypothetical protein